LAAGVLGIGYILPNVATILILWYVFSQYTMSSVAVITHMCGIILFIVASIILMVVGIFIIIGGIQFYRRSIPSGVLFIGTLLTSFYLLCLGVASTLIVPQLNIDVVMLLISPVLIMVGAATYMAPSRTFKLIGSALGIVGGTLLAFVIFDFKALGLILNRWNIPFLGPFMSKSILEGAAVILGALAVFIHSMLSGRKEEPVSHVFLSIVALVYGIGVFIGPLNLSFTFWDLIWKAPWMPPLHGVPGWVLVTTVFWSASLIVLAIGGIILMVSSCLGFMFAAQEFSQLHVIGKA